MGFVKATGDTICRCGDVALDEGQQCPKVMDDVLLWDEDYGARLRIVFEALVHCCGH